MKSPAHPGRLLKDDIEALGLTVAEAAKSIGVTRQQLYRVMNGFCAVSPEMAFRLEKAIERAPTLGFECRPLLILQPCGGAERR